MLQTIYYPTDESISSLKAELKKLANSDATLRFSVNHEDKYLKYTNRKVFGNYLLEVLEQGFDFLSLNPKNSEGYVHLDIASKGDVYSSYTIIRNNNKKNYKDKVRDLSKKRLELFAYVSKFDEGVSSGDIINSAEWYRKSNVSGRLSELDELCLIKVIGDRINPATNLPNSVYVAVGEEEHKLLVDARINQYRDRISEIVSDKQKRLSESTNTILNNELRRISQYLKLIKGYG